MNVVLFTLHCVQKSCSPPLICYIHLLALLIVSLYDCFCLLASFFTTLCSRRAQQSTVRPCSSGLVRIADSCCGVTDCTGHTHIHKHSSGRGQGRVMLALIKPPPRQSSAWKFGHGKRPGVRASTLMASF